jgi:hypothetical protein
MLADTQVLVRPDFWAAMRYSTNQFFPARPQGSSSLPIISSMLLGVLVASGTISIERAGFHSDSWLVERESSIGLS